MEILNLKNQNYDWNKIVINYINNAEELDLGVFLLFLQKNSLPLKLEWVYYLLGKLDQSELSTMVLNALSTGEKELKEVFPEIGEWEDISSIEFRNKSNEIVRFDFNSKDTIDEIWNRVKKQIEFRNEELAYETYLENISNAIEYGENNSSVCPVCHESPCMCSDPQYKLD